MNNDNLFFPNILELTENLSPGDTVNMDINKFLLEKVKIKIGDKCHKDGYIKKDTITITDRSIGKIISSHFNGDIVFNLRLSVDICKPVQGDKIACTVIGKNNAGIMAKNDPLFVALSPFYHSNTEIFDSIKENDNILVEVVASQYEFNDENIQVIGKFVEKL